MLTRAGPCPHYSLAKSPKNADLDAEEKRMETNHSGSDVVNYWRNVFAIWAAFFTLILLASLAIALYFHATLGLATFLSTAFVLVHWVPPALCRWKARQAAGFVAMGIGMVWVARLIASYGTLVEAIRQPSARGLVGEAAVFVIGISSATVFIAGGLKIYRTARTEENQEQTKQPART